MDGKVPSPERALERLLAELFTPDELRRWLWGRSAAPSIVELLPVETGGEALTAEAVRLLVSRGEVDAQLFEDLVEVRPQREQEIRAVQDGFRRQEEVRPGGEPPRGQGAKGAKETRAEGAERRELTDAGEADAEFGGERPERDEDARRTPTSERAPLAPLASWPLGASTPTGSNILQAVALVLGLVLLLVGLYAAAYVLVIGGGGVLTALGAWLLRRWRQPVGPAQPEVEPPPTIEPYSGPRPDYRDPQSAELSEQMLRVIGSLRAAQLRQVQSILTRKGRTTGLARNEDTVNELRQEFRSLQARFRSGGDILPGDILEERYLVLRKIGQGAVGTVWHGWDLVLQQAVALKLFHGHLTKDPILLSQLFKAMGEVARLQRKSLCPVGALLSTDQPGYVMPLLSGGSLQARASQPEIPSRALWTALLSVGDALAYAHGVGVTHGALHPGDVLFDEEGRAFLTGLGEGSITRVPDAQTRAPQPGLPIWMAPETLEADVGDPERADQYSFALLVLLVLRREPPPGVLAIRPGLLDGLLLPFPAHARALRRALSVDPEGRYPSIDAFLADLREIASEPQPTLPASPPLPRENPFQPGNPLRSAEVPPGRDRSAAELLERVLSHGSAALLGPRRSGKTSLLEHMARRLADTHSVRKVSLELVSCRTPDDLARALEPSLAAAPSPASALIDLLRAEDKRWPVLLLDEVGYLRNADVEVQPNVFGWLRGIGQELASVIYAGSHGDWAEALGQAARLPGSSFGNDVAAVVLGPLDYGDALGFLEARSPPDARILPEPTGRWIAEICGTWPFYLQVMGYALVAESRSGKRKIGLDRNNIQDIYERSLLSPYTSMFRERWEELPPRARELILASPEGLPRYGELSRADRELLSEAMLYDGLSGWSIQSDKPLLDWIARKRSELQIESEGA